VAVVLVLLDLRSAHLLESFHHYLLTLLKDVPGNGNIRLVACFIRLIINVLCPRPKWGLCFWEAANTFSNLFNLLSPNLAYYCIPYYLSKCVLNLSAFVTIKSSRTLIYLTCKSIRIKLIANPRVRAYAQCQCLYLIINQDKWHLNFVDFFLANSRVNKYSLLTCYFIRFFW
jgi:hypothetical protein